LHFSENSSENNLVGHVIFYGNPVSTLALFSQSLIFLFYFFLKITIELGQLIQVFSVGFNFFSGNFDGF